MRTATIRQIANNPFLKLPDDALDELDRALKDIKDYIQNKEQPRG